MVSPTEQAPATDSPPPGLSAKQVQAVYALAAGTNKKATAKMLGVEAHTLTRWGQLLAFRALLAQVSNNLEADSLYAVKAQRSKALETLSELMDEQHPAQVRLSAARAALELQTAQRAEDPATPVGPAVSFETLMKFFSDKGKLHENSTEQIKAGQPLQH